MTQIQLWDRDHVVLAGDGQFELSIRESSRARQLILQVMPPRAVEIVVPRGTRAEVVQQFVNEHRVWIDRACAEMTADHPEPNLLPQAIDLAALGERLAVRYASAGRGKARFRHSGHTLRLQCAEPGCADAPTLLRRWMLMHGGRVLKPWLARVAGELGFAPKRAQVRLQRTRWGSCSATGSISLNAALLLIAPELVRYLMIHELCHLRHMSHSAAYWQTVARCEPDFRRLDAELAAAWRKLPGWYFRLSRQRAA